MAPQPASIMASTWPPSSATVASEPPLNGTKFSLMPAARDSRATVIWPSEPVPTDATLTLPGLALA
ncbi:hypothetical protein D3C81_719630 [compost metagenome]